MRTSRLRDYLRFGASAGAILLDVATFVAAAAITARLSPPGTALQLLLLTLPAYLFAALSMSAFGLFTLRKRARALTAGTPESTDSR